MLTALHAYLRALLQSGAVRDGDAPTLDGDPPRLLKILHHPRDGLAPPAGHLGDRLMRERFLNRVGASLLGEVEEEPGDATRDVQQRDPADLVVCPAQAPGQL